MNRATVHQLHNDMQQRQQGIFTMQGFAFEKLIHEIICDYGTFKDGSFTVRLSDLSNSDKMSAFIFVFMLVLCVYNIQF